MTVKNILSVIVGCLIMVGSVFGATENYSCQMGDLQPDAYAGGLVQVTGLLDILSVQDVAIAVTMLKRSCCARGLLAENYCQGQSVGPNYQPQSPYLIDHLMHVGMVKMDGDQEVCEILGLEGCAPANLETDIQPVQRRRSIREIAESTDGTPARQIQQLFESYRGGGSALSDQAQGTMIQGYYRLCDDIIKVLGTGIAAVNEFDAYGSCVNRIRQRYDQEKTYVQTLMVEKGSQYLANAMRDYLQEYFADQRLSGLATKYRILEACRKMVLQVAQPTSTCCT